MQQAHHCFLMLEWTGFYDGTAQYLNQPTAKGIYNDTSDDTCKGICTQIRDERQSCQTQDGRHLRGNDALAITDLVYKPGAEHIYYQLCEIENGGDQSNSPHGNAIVSMKF